MLRITHTRGRMAPAVEHFATPCLRIGSAPGNELFFAGPAGAGVAPRHAEIRQEGGAYYVIDLGSPGGTFVGPARVGQQPLRGGETIALGGPDGPEFRVEILPPRSRAVAVPAAPPPPAAAPPPIATGSEGGVDLATAERMVKAAVLQATAGVPAANEKASLIVSARVGTARRRARLYNRLLALGIVLTFAAAVYAGVLLWRSRQATDQLSADVGIDRSPGAAAPKGTIPTRIYTGREVYDLNRSAVYLIGYLKGNITGACCTAFAIQPNLLATNAHCVTTLREKGGTPIVTQNDSGGKVRFHVLASTIHPGYKSGKAAAGSPDVGLLRIDGRMPKTVTLANDAELHAIGSGDDVFVLGFPARVMDPLSPSVTFLQGRVGRLTNMDDQAAGELTLIQHDAPTRGGNSGSPIFNQYGHVIGVHAAHLDDEDEVKVDGQKTKVTNASPFRIGMRADLLRGVPQP